MKRMQTNMVKGDAAGFAQRLAELKKHGSLVLVRAADTAAETAVSTQLLGDIDRVPVFVLLGADRSVIDERISRPETIAESHIVQQAVFYRSATESTAGERGSTPQRLTRLPGLLDEITQTIETVADQQAEALGPGDLRVCLHPMTPIVDGFTRDQIEGFLSEFQQVLTSYAGMGHASMSLTTVPDQYDWLDTAFDAIVEAQSIGGVPQERWRLPGSGHVTEWFPVDEVEY